MIRYDPRFPNISHILHKHWKVMVQDPRMKEIFKNPPMVSYSRCKSLRDMLVRAKLPSPTTNNNNTRSCRAGFSRCRRGGDLCMMCVTSPARASSHTSTNTGETWPITSQVTCTTKNCVYRITCEKQCGDCKKILPYIGITKNRACDRIQQHRGSIFNPGQQGSTKAVSRLDPKSDTSPHHCFSIKIFLPVHFHYSYLQQQTLNNTNQVNTSYCIMLFLISNFLISHFRSTEDGSVFTSEIYLESDPVVKMESSR